MAPDAGVVIGEALQVALAAFAYEGPMRKALAGLKYGGTSRLAPILADAAAPALQRLLAIEGEATLVPVPVHAERRRARGYNQAELIARRLAEASRLPIGDLLVRARSTTKQHRLDRAARLKNLRGAFGIAPGVGVPGRVIVIDDIITTNATLEACASVLADAGCAAVYGFAIAQEV